MKSKLLLAAVLTLSASSGIFAQQAGSATPPPKTREQVLEELKQAQANGSDMPTGFLAYHAPTSKEPAPTPTKTATASKN